MFNLLITALTAAIGLFVAFLLGRFLYSPNRRIIEDPPTVNIVDMDYTGVRMIVGDNDYFIPLHMISGVELTNNTLKIYCHGSIMTIVEDSNAINYHRNLLRIMKQSTRRW
jgi:hypothetical protein